MRRVLRVDMNTQTLQVRNKKVTNSQYSYWLHPPGHAFLSANDATNFTNIYRSPARLGQLFCSPLNPNASSPSFASSHDETTVTDHVSNRPIQTPPGQSTPPPGQPSSRYPRRLPTWAHKPLLEAQPRFAPMDSDVHFPF
uniref:Uncharacterized protein n=1 Tax=Mesocestoides corti TaxID=53468 RepID=A0A5K3EVH9_MESCO